MSLCKVASHVSPDDVPDSELEVTLGNHAADTAAGRARLQEMPLVLSDLKEVEEWHKQQQSQTVQFCEYLLKLARFVVSVKARLRQGADHPSAEIDPSVLAERWIARNPILACRVKITTRASTLRCLARHGLLGSWNRCGSGLQTWPGPLRIHRRTSRQGSLSLS